jgi:hypothetical protein
LALSLLSYGAEVAVALKLCRLVNPVPPVLMAKIEPLPAGPP